MRLHSVGGEFGERQWVVNLVGVPFSTRNARDAGVTNLCPK
jgi:hypothetical protein